MQPKTIESTHTDTILACTVSALHICLLIRFRCIARKISATRLV